MLVDSVGGRKIQSSLIGWRYDEGMKTDQACSIIFAIFVATIFVSTAKGQRHDNATKSKYQLSSPSGVEFDSMSEDQTQNLFTLCKVWGFLKYRHPSLASGEIDLDLELIRLLQAADQPRFDAVLAEWIEQFNAVSASQARELIPRDMVFLAEFDWISKDGLLPQTVAKSLETIRRAKPSTPNAYVKPDQWGITPRFMETAYPQFDYRDDGHKLLLLFRYWNIVEYFFPYKSLMDDDWDEVLLEFIPRFTKTTDELSLKLLLLELIAKLRDSHAFVVQDDCLNNHFGKQQLPLELKLIQGMPVVTSLFQPVAADVEIRKGDILVAIDGVTIEDLIERKHKYVSASTSASESRELAQLLIRTPKDALPLVVERSGARFEANVQTIRYDVLRFIQRDCPSIRQIDDQTVCLYPGALKPGEFEGMLAQIHRSPRLVIDYRCYPSQSIQQALPNLLLEQPTAHFAATQFDPSRIGTAVWQPNATADRRNKNAYRGEVAILVNEFTQSQPEFEILALLKAPNVIVVGSPTSGAVGNWTPIPLPGKITTSFSGNGIYTSDRRQVQRVGIQLDVEVHPTIAGIRDGEDEILNKALEVLGRQ